MENKWPGWHPEKVMRQKSVRKPPFQILRKTKKPSFSLPFFAARAAGLIPACPPLGSNEARWPVLRQM
jgi:hypothetical protein